MTVPPASVEAAELIARAAGVPVDAVATCLAGLAVTVTHGPEQPTGPHQDWSEVDRPLARWEARVDSDEVVLVITGDTVEVAERVVSWRGPGTPVAGRGEVREFHPSAWPDPVERTDVLTTLLAETRTRRRRKYALCRGCGRWTPEEHRYEDSLCQGCASRLYGVVY